MEVVAAFEAFIASLDGSPARIGSVVGVQRREEERTAVFANRIAKVLAASCVSLDALGDEHRFSEENDEGQQRGTADEASDDQVCWHAEAHAGDQRDARSHRPGCSDQTATCRGRSRSLTCRERIPQ